MFILGNIRSVFDILEIILEIRDRELIEVFQLKIPRRVVLIERVLVYEKLEENLQITCIGDAGTGARRRFDAAEIHRAEIWKLIEQVTQLFCVVTVDLFIVF